MAFSAEALSESRTRLKGTSRPHAASKSQTPIISNTLEYEELTKRLASVNCGYSYDQMVEFCNLEHWYPLIKQFSPESRWIPLALEQGNTMRNCYKQWTDSQWRRKFRATSSDLGKGKDNEDSINIIPLLSVLDSPSQESFHRLVDYLKSQIDIIATENPAFAGSFVFVKCSSRSAKNTVLQRDSFHREYRRQLEALKVEWQSAHPTNSSENILAPIPEGELLNMKFIALIRAGTLGLQFSVVAPEEIMEILCKSERIAEDFESALERSQADAVKYPWNQAICLRRWIPIDPILEFRCFVSGGRLRAISQYNHVVYSPTIVRFQKEIQQSISALFEEFRVPLAEDSQNRWPSYVVDLGFLDASEDEKTAELSGCWTRKPVIIELNPYYCTTDGGLFNWSDKNDCSILTPDDKDFSERPAITMRIRTEFSNISMDSLLPAWREVLMQ